jgi:hypothetical protein
MLSEIQLACAARLNAIAFFTTPTPILVLTEQKADYEVELDNQVAALGLCLLILTVTATDAQNQMLGANAAPAIAFKKIDVRARALGDPSVNNTGVSVSSLAEAAAWHLRGFKPIANEGPLVLESIELVEDRSAPLAYDAIFSLSAKSATAPARPT